MAYKKRERAQKRKEMEVLMKDNLLNILTVPGTPIRQGFIFIFSFSFSYMIIVFIIIIIITIQTWTKTIFYRIQVLFKRNLYKIASKSPNKSAKL